MMFVCFRFRFFGLFWADRSIERICFRFLLSPLTGLIKSVDLLLRWVLDRLLDCFCSLFASLFISIFAFLFTLMAGSSSAYQSHSFRYLKVFSLRAWILSKNFTLFAALCSEKNSTGVSFSLCASLDAASARKEAVLFSLGKFLNWS